MNDFPRWKYVLVAVVLLFGILYGIPNLFPQQPSVQITANRGATVDRGAQGKDARHPREGQDPVPADRSCGRASGRCASAASDDQTKASDALRTELGDSYIVALNLASTVPGWMRAIGANAMPLGLDLRGGVHFLMQVDDKDVMEKQLQRYADDIRSALRDKNIRYQSVGRGGNGLVVTLRSAEDRDAALTAIQAKMPDLTIANGQTVGDAYNLDASVKDTRIKEIAQNTIRQNVAHAAQPHQRARRRRAADPAAGRHAHRRRARRRAGSGRGEEDPRHDRDARIPRRRRDRDESVRGREERHRAAGQPPLSPPRARRGRQARSDRAQEEDHRLAATRWSMRRARPIRSPARRPYRSC